MLRRRPAAGAQRQPGARRGKELTQQLTARQKSRERLLVARAVEDRPLVPVPRSLCSGGAGGGSLAAFLFRHSVCEAKSFSIGSKNFKLKTVDNGGSSMQLDPF